MDILSTVYIEIVPSDRLLIFFNLDRRMVDPKPSTNHSRLLQDLISIASSNVRAHSHLIVIQTPDMLVMDISKPRNRL